MRALVFACVLLLGACAAHPPPTIVVADKDVKLRWESEIVGHRSHPTTGRAQEIRRESLYREYWVKAVDGDWYQVPRRDWEAALVGQSLTVHPALGERVTEPPGIGPCLGPDGRWRC